MAFRLGIIGAGLITENSHLPAALATSDVRLEAVVDPVASRAASLVRRFGIDAQVARDVGEVLGQLDGAVIATPNDTHKEIAVRCLDAGIPVLLEKPLASNYVDGLAIVEIAKRNAKTLAVGYCTRFRQSTLLLKRLLEIGYFGRVSRFYHQFGTPGGWVPLSGYILNRESVGGGVLVITGTHFLDRMIHYWGYPELAALADDGAGGPEANAVATFRYERGAASIEGKVRYSKTTALPGGMAIETEAGIVTLADNDTADLMLRPSRNSELCQVIRSANEAPVADVFQAQLEDFVRACRGGGEPRVTGQQGLLSLRLTEELYGNRVRLIDQWYDQPMESAWACA
jgi:predicted dehydrogenase